MNATVEDLRATIVPRSDQLNSEQLLGGPITITVTDVRIGATAEQPVVVHYEGEAGRPYKPCLTMRKLLVHAWGADGRAWIGRAMTLYNDPDVKFGGETVGGIRISHLSDIGRGLQVSLTSTRGKKAKYRVEPLAPAARPAPVDAAEAQARAASVAEQVKRGEAQMAADWLASLPKAEKSAIWRHLAEDVQQQLKATRPTPAPPVAPAKTEA